MLRNRAFRFLWISQASRLLGSRFTELAIPLLVLQATGSIVQAAAVSIAGVIAGFAIGLPAGVWLEQREKRLYAQIAECISAVVLLGLVMMIATDNLSIWLLLTAFSILGGAGALYRISFHALLPSAVQRGQLVKAHNAIEGADAVSTLAGPLLAGGLISLTGVAFALAADAVLLILSFSMLSLLVVKKRSEMSSPLHRSMIRAAAEGIRYQLRTKVKRVIVWNQLVLSFTTVVMTFSVIMLTRLTYDMAEWQTGVVLSAAGAGNLAGVWLMNRYHRAGWKSFMRIVLLISGMGAFILTVSDHLIWLCVGMFVFDGALSMAFVLNGAAKQAVTADGYLARVAAGNVVLTALISIIGYTFAGTIAEQVSPYYVILAVSVLLVVSGIRIGLVKMSNGPLDQWATKEELE